MASLHERIGIRLYKSTNVSSRTVIDDHLFHYFSVDVYIIENNVNFVNIF